MKGTDQAAKIGQLTVVGGQAKPDRFCQETIETLELLLARARAGFLPGFAGVLFDHRLARHSITTGYAFANTGKSTHALSELWHAHLHGDILSPSECMAVFDEMNSVTEMELRRRLLGLDALSGRY
jgi:hypothetical protein